MLRTLETAELTHGCLTHGFLSVQGSGFRVQGLRFRVYGLPIRHQIGTLTNIPTKRNIYIYIHQEP